MKRARTSEGGSRGGNNRGGRGGRGSSRGSRGSSRGSGRGGRDRAPAQEASPAPSPAPPAPPATSQLGKLLSGIRKSSKVQAAQTARVRPDAVSAKQPNAPKRKHRADEDDVEDHDDEDDDDDDDDDGDDGDDQDSADAASDNDEDEDGDGNSNDDDGPDTRSLFEKHFGDSVSDSLLHTSVLVDANSWDLDVHEHPILNRIMTSVLKDTPSASHFSIDDLDTDRSLVADLDVKNRIAEKWPDVNGKITKKTGGDSFTPLQKALFPLMNSYADLLYTNQDFKFRKDITNLMALHALNHVYKANDRVIRNTTKLKAELAENKPASDLRDQGFTRPKVLIIQPFRNNAFEVIQTLIALSGTKTQDNKKRFMDEFGSDPADEKRESKKPDEYRKIFAGNVDDCFRVGIKFSRKHMKLFSDFYASDIIVASPLGLKLVIGADGDKKRDFDFLSSIEVVIVDMADVLLMQNWDHVRAVFDHLNLIPNNAHDCDFSRVRSYTLDGRSKYVRQNLIFARYATPEINALQSAYSKNVGGRIRISRPYRGTISDVVVSIPQLFHRMPPHALSAGPDARFAYFIEKILPTLRQSVVQQSHTLIVVPSYFDFVRLRNYLAEHNYHQVGPISEYTSRSEADSYRHRFAKGVGGGGEELTDIAYLLVTERYHFFRRPVIKGVRHVVFYQLPQNAGFYAELVNQVDASAGEVTCSVVYSAADKMVLERVVGSDRVERMIKGQKDTYLFTS